MCHEQMGLEPMNRPGVGVPGRPPPPALPPRPPPRPPQPGQPPAVLSHTGSSASLMGVTGTNPHHETSSLNDTLDRSGH